LGVHQKFTIPNDRDLLAWVWGPTTFSLLLALFVKFPIPKDMPLELEELKFQEE
jgi:hypothetical protein